MTSTRGDPDPSLHGFHRQRSFLFVRTIVRALLRPHVLGIGRRDLRDAVFALERQSAFDEAVLERAIGRGSSAGRESIQDTLQAIPRRFSLKHAAGWHRRLITHPSHVALRRMHRAQQAASQREINIVPVTIYWGRTMPRKNPGIRRLFSLDWGPGSVFRRWACLLLNRSDVFVHFTPSIPARELFGANEQPDRAIEHALRTLENRFRSDRIATLGPALDSRRSLINRIVASPAVRKHVSNGSDADSKLREAVAIANVLASGPVYPVIRLATALVGWFWRHVYSQIIASGHDRLRELAYTHTLVFAPNHRSHIDYVVLSYVLYVQGLMIPHIAAGDNLNTPLLGPPLRRCGAFFIKRSLGGDPIYRAVLTEYLNHLSTEGHSMEFFVEGTRSRTGKSLSPRRGFVQMFLEQRSESHPRPVAFVPVHFSYEKLVEGDSYLKHLQGAKKGKEQLSSLVRAVRLIRHEFGEVNIRFGEPIKMDLLPPSLSSVNSAMRPSVAVAEHIVREINRCSFVNDVNLLSVALQGAKSATGLQEDELSTRLESARELVNMCADQQGHRCTSRSATEILQRCCSLGYLSKSQRAGQTVWIPEQEAAPMLPWYLESVMHTLAIPAVLAWSALRSAEAEADPLKESRPILEAMALEYSFDLDCVDVASALSGLQQKGLGSHATGSRLPAMPLRSCSAVAMIQSLVNRTILRLCVDLRLFGGPLPGSGGARSTYHPQASKRNQIMERMGFSPFEFRHSRLARRLASQSKIGRNNQFEPQGIFPDLQRVLSAALPKHELQRVTHVLARDDDPSWCHPVSADTGSRER